MNLAAKTKAFAINALCLSALSLSATVHAQNPVNLPDQVGPTMTADPFTVHQKFEYRFLQTVGLHGYLGAAAGAAIGQARNVPHEWGQGLEGYASRYASDFGTNVARQSIEFGLETALHEDPRYFPSEDKRLGARLKNVLLQTVVTRTDSGREAFAWARMSSAFAAGAITNAWQPESTDTPGRAASRGCIMLGGDFAYNFLQEFVPFFRPRGLRH
jgi:hypothetical protein